VTPAGDRVARGSLKAPCADAMGRPRSPNVAAMPRRCIGSSQSGWSARCGSGVVAMERIRSSCRPSTWDGRPAPRAPRRRLDAPPRTRVRRRSVDGRRTPRPQPSRPAGLPRGDDRTPQRPNGRTLEDARPDVDALDANAATYRVPVVQRLGYLVEQAAAHIGTIAAPKHRCNLRHHGEHGPRGRNRSRRRSLPTAHPTQHRAEREQCERAQVTVLANSATGPRRRHRNIHLELRPRHAQPGRNGIAVLAPVAGPPALRRRCTTRRHRCHIVTTS